MKLRKADEMEQFQNEKSTKNGFIFYTVALLGWALFDMFTKGTPGVQMTFLLIGCAIYFWSRVAYHNKMK
ncbi:hypothetical protein MH117_02750 [Paenibacillus sp. ACRRX]|nr:MULTISPECIES: hypothetical protein [unclassified Paenibacillus]MCG7406321.1 hypothetical protein [Paenibacillus sp. ACRRX]MDK8179356.1 hypothetical protein [Paenibacillus sp. UMB4589-SE434]